MMYYTCRKPRGRRKSVLRKHTTHPELYVGLNRRAVSPDESGLVTEEANVDEVLDLIASMHVKDVKFSKAVDYTINSFRELNREPTTSSTNYPQPLVEYHTGWSI